MNNVTLSQIILVNDVRLLMICTSFLFFCSVPCSMDRRQQYRQLCFSQRQSMFQVRLLLCFFILAFAKAKSDFIRGEIINPASRKVNNHNNNDRKTAQNNRQGPNVNKIPLQNILKFQAAKMVSGSQPSRKVP